MKGSAWILIVCAMPLGLSFGQEVSPVPLADVDWDAALEPLSYTPDAPGGFYPWRAPRMKAEETIRAEMGVENLREVVYLRGVRVLDEGYWDGRAPGSRPTLHEALYDRRATYVDAQGRVVTRWQRGGCVLERAATVRSDGCDLLYRIWVLDEDEPPSTDGGEDSPVPPPWPDGQVAIGILWHDEPEVGDPRRALAYIEKRIREPNVVQPGIRLPGLELRVHYTFDDAVKEWADPAGPSDPDRPALIAWDGANAYDFAIRGIPYEDPRFSPLTALPEQPGGSPAIWGIVHVANPARPPELEVETGHLAPDDPGWHGVGPHGKYTQMATVRFRSPVSPVGFIRGDADGSGQLPDPRDIGAIDAYLFDFGTLPCYDAGDVNDDGHLTLEDAVYLGDYLQGGPEPPPPFPEPGRDPTPDNITCHQVRPADPIPPDPRYLLRLAPAQVGGVPETVRFFLSMEYPEAPSLYPRATQAHAAIRYRGLRFVRARSLLPLGWEVRAVDFPAASVEGAELGLTLFWKPIPEESPGDVPIPPPARRPPIPEGRIVEITFWPGETYGARLERVVGQGNLYFYTGVGIDGGPFIPGLRRTDLAFIRGDANASGSVPLEIADAIVILQYLFGGGDLPCLDAGDANDRMGITIADPIHILSYLFAGGPPPPPPFPEIGFDPTPDELDCADYPQGGLIVGPPALE